MNAATFGKDAVNLLLRVVERHGCWVWTSAIKSNGYGVFRVDGRLQHAHRLSYQAFKGPIPPGLVIDHLCRNRACVNPDHLEPVTKRENAMRGLPGIKPTVCKRGHPLVDGNLYFNKNGGRCCKACFPIRRKENA